MGGSRPQVHWFQNHRELCGLSKPAINWKRLEITVRRSWDG